MEPADTQDWSSFDRVPIGSTRVMLSNTPFPITLRWSPLLKSTVALLVTYRTVNPAFKFDDTWNPRRPLTKPVEPVSNDGYDNVDCDLIMYVGDVFVSETDGKRYVIQDLLGQGTFGQVVKGIETDTGRVFAIKVIKNKAAYHNQALTEVRILQLLNSLCVPGNDRHVIRLEKVFMYRNHMCLVFEMLSINLYELIKQNKFRGLSLNLIRVFVIQMVEALQLCWKGDIIHCDLKPENILLVNDSPQIKIIDLGSACFDGHTVYSYIQSRFYRSPEVLLQCSYGKPIDVWSLACVCAELFLGLPLFPGVSEFNQMTRIVDMLGLPPTSMLERGKSTRRFFAMSQVASSSFPSTMTVAYRIKTDEEYARDSGLRVQEWKKYFNYRFLDDIVMHFPMKKGLSPLEESTEMNNRLNFIHFLYGMLQLDPMLRWTPNQVSQHPFLQGLSYDSNFVPLPDAQSTASAYMVNPISMPDYTTPSTDSSKAAALGPPQTLPTTTNTSSNNSNSKSSSSKNSSNNNNPNPTSAGAEAERHPNATTPSNSALNPKSHQHMTVSSPSDIPSIPLGTSYHSYSLNTGHGSADAMPRISSLNYEDDAMLSAATPTGMISDVVLSNISELDPLSPIPPTQDDFGEWDPFFNDFEDSMDAMVSDEEGFPESTEYYPTAVLRGVGDAMDDVDAGTQQQSGAPRRSAPAMDVFSPQQSTPVFWPFGMVSTMSGAETAMTSYQYLPEPAVPLGTSVPRSSSYMQPNNSYNNYNNK